jgi:hypothetical protein
MQMTPDIAEAAEKPSVMITGPLCYLCKAQPAGHGDYYRHSAYCEGCQFIVCDPDYRIVESPKGLVPQKIVKRAYVKGAAWRPGGRRSAVQNDLVAA